MPWMNSCLVSRDVDGAVCSGQSLGESGGEGGRLKPDVGTFGLADAASASAAVPEGEGVEDVGTRRLL